MSHREGLIPAAHDNTWLLVRAIKINRPEGGKPESAQSVCRESMATAIL